MSSHRWELSNGYEWSVFCVTKIGDLFIDAWFVMLAFAIAHKWSHGIPAFGYWQSLFFGFVVTGLVSSGNADLTRRITRLGRLVATGE